MMTANTKLQYQKTFQNIVCLHAHDVSIEMMV